MKNLKSVLALTIICICVALLLGVVNEITAPIIEASAQNELNSTLIEVLEEGSKIEGEVNLAEYENIPEGVVSAHKANTGYVIQVKTRGYADGLVILCGINNEGALVKTAVLSSGETHGREKTYGENFIGKTLDTVDGVDTITGSTSTTAAFKGAVKTALGTAKILGGGSFDNRTEEEIALDEALPAAEGKFTVWFETEVLPGISRVYMAENGAGYVFITTDGSYVGADSDGKATATTSVDTAALVATIKSSNPVEVDISAIADMPGAVTKVLVTASGNYVFELKASGYGINGDKYTASGQYIYLKACISADGKLISCETISQKETEGIGSICQTQGFYDKYTDKDKDGVSGVDAATGATITSRGYKTALLRAFEAFELLKGDGEE